jgi:short-subunit dehydrogenase
MPSFALDSKSTEVANTLHYQIAGRAVLITRPSPEGIGATLAQTLAAHDPALIILASHSKDLAEQTEIAIKA